MNSYFFAEPAITLYEVHLGARGLYAHPEVGTENRVKLDKSMVFPRPSWVEPQVGDLLVQTCLLEDFLSTEFVARKESIHLGSLGTPPSWAKRLKVRSFPFEHPFDAFEALDGFARNTAVTYETSYEGLFGPAKTFRPISSAMAEARFPLERFSNPELVLIYPGSFVGAYGYEDRVSRCFLRLFSYMDSIGGGLILVDQVEDIGSRSEGFVNGFLKAYAQLQ